MSGVSIIWMKRSSTYLKKNVPRKKIVHSYQGGKIEKDYEGKA
jgi:hypothetical protein